MVVFILLSLEKQGCYKWFYLIFSLKVDNNDVFIPLWWCRNSQNASKTCFSWPMGPDGFKKVLHDIL